MRIAYLECFSGMSGDMFLGALIDAGVPPRVLEETVAALELGARLEIARVVRSGISATKVDVWVDCEKDLPREEYLAKQNVARALLPAKANHEHAPHSHADAHNHELATDREHHHGHEHASEAEISGVPAPHEHSHGRGLTEIREIISRAGISDRAKKTAIAIFENLGEAEAKI